MNLDNSLAFFINQGPIFWAASAAVGAGGALLITSLFIALRRLFARTIFPLRITLPAARRGANAEKASARPEIQVTETGYALATGSRVNPETTPAASSTDLIALLQRLQSAGNRLEEALSSGSGAGSTYSPLKAPAAMVEQETRVGAG